MPIQRFNVCAPLQDFFGVGDSLELAPDLWIRRRADVPDPQDWSDRLGDDERTKLSFVEHWLIFGWTEDATRTPGETVNLALLSFWLVKPTKTHVAFRFKFSPDPAISGAGMARLLDRFQWIPDATEATFGTADLQAAAKHFRSLSAVSPHGRLNDALRLTLSGCVSRQWQVALICFAAAAEALLTSGTGPGLTRRLARAYACLVERESIRRDAAFEHFCNLYKMRSHIVHGRSREIAPEERLPMLASFSDMMRTLWRAVIRCDELIEILEGTDKQRASYFRTLCSSYISPPKQGGSLVE